MADIVAEEQLSLKGLLPGGEGHQAREVLLAEIENRLRRTILRIIRPSLDQHVDMNRRLDLIATKVEHHESILDSSDRMREVVDKQAEITGVLKDQLNTRDEQARVFEKQTLVAITELRSHFQEIEVKLEEQQNELQRAHRESTRIWDDVERMQREHDEVLRRIWDGINGSFKKADKIRDEFVANLGEMHRLHNTLTEDLFGEDTGLTKLRSDHVQLTKFVQHLPDVESDVGKLTQKLDSLHSRQDECEGVCTKAHVAYQELTLNTEQKLADMADEFREGLNQLVAHHASLMKGMRTDFQHELENAKSTRDEVKDLENKTHRYCQDIADDLRSETKRVDSMHKQLIQELDEIKSRRKRERHSHESEFGEVKRDMAIQQEVVTSFHGSLSYVCRVLGLVLEGERITSALHVQDYVDRLGQRWLGRPEDLDHRAQTAHTADMLEKLPRRFPGDIGLISGNPSMHELVPVDVRKGLAKLGYVPGRVPYGGSHYDRQDMLLLHNKLLQKAHTAFERGPPKDPLLASLKELACVVAGQPSAIGGTGGSHCSSLRVAMGRPKKTFGCGSEADDFSEDPKSTAASTGTHRLSTHGSRQRPGSQGHRPGSTGQPQGTGSRGSRGTMFGTLGDTEPPSDAYRPEGLGPPDKLSGGGRGSLIRLPIIEGLGSNTAREQPSAGDEAAESGALRASTAR